MPIWGWIYIAIVCVCGFFAYKMNRDRGAYYLPGEVLSVIAIVVLFLIAYGVLNFENDVVLSCIILAYICYWEGWENRHNYSFSKMSDEVSDAFLEESEPEEELDEETAMYIGKAFTIFSYVLALTFLLPVVYVFSKIVFQN